MRVLENFKLDYYRMTGETFKINIRCIMNILIRQNLKYVFLYRLSNKIDNNLIKKIFKIRMYFLGRKYGIEILPSTKIGDGLYIGHPYNITINQDTNIGNNVNIMKGVTIGIENRGSRRGCPVIGNKVYIGINSTIVGNIKIGNDVMIAPNSFVNIDIPDHSIVIGNPCKVIHKENATDGYVNFLV